MGYLFADHCFSYVNDVSLAKIEHGIFTFKYLKFLWINSLSQFWKIFISMTFTLLHLLFGFIQCNLVEIISIMYGVRKKHIVWYLHKSICKIFSVFFLSFKARHHYWTVLQAFFESIRCYRVEISEAFPEPSQASQIEYFATITTNN